MKRCEKVLKRIGFVLWMSFWGVLWIESSIWLIESSSLSIGVIDCLNIMASIFFLAACGVLAAQVQCDPL